MRIVAFEHGGQARRGVRRVDEIIDLSIAAPSLPGKLGMVLAQGPGALETIRTAADKIGKGAVPAASSVKLLPPLPAPGKIVCIGLNYIDHAKESRYKDLPKYPVVFGRYANSLVAHGVPMVRPRNSERFDWEGEVATPGYGPHGRRRNLNRGSRNAPFGSPPARSVLRSI